MRFIGHRGASHVAPENTMAAVQSALDHGVGFEIDLQLLRDDTLVVLHDDTLERTARPDYGERMLGIDVAACVYVRLTRLHALNARSARTHRAIVREPVTRLRWCDVEAVDVGSWFDSCFENEQPPLFRQVLRELCRAAVPGSEAHCFAELKGERQARQSLCLIR